MRKVPKENKKTTQELTEKNYTVYEKRRAFLKSLLIFTVVLMVLLVSAFFTGLTPLGQITVKENVKYTAEEIEQASGLELGKTSVISKINSAKDNIIHQLPYIQSVKIDRVGKNVTITVQECTAKYALEQGEKYILLDEYMKILEVGADSAPKGVLNIAGLDPTGVSVGYKIEVQNNSGIELLEKIVNLIKDSGMKDITKINISDINNIELWYQNRLQLIMGGIDDLEYNLSFAKETISREDAVNPHQSGSFDFAERGKANFKPYIPTTIPTPKPTLPITPTAVVSEQPTATEISVSELSLSATAVPTT